MTRRMKVVLVFSHVVILAIGFAAGAFSSIARLLREGSLMTSGREVFYVLIPSKRSTDD